MRSVRSDLVQARRNQMYHIAGQTCEAQFYPSVVIVFMLRKFCVNISLIQFDWFAHDADGHPNSSAPAETASSNGCVRSCSDAW